MFKVGDRVESRYQGGQYLFKGNVTAVHQNDGTYDIRYARMHTHTHTHIHTDTYTHNKHAHTRTAAP